MAVLTYLAVIFVVGICVFDFSEAYPDSCPSDQILREQSRLLQTLADKITALDDKVAELTLQVARKTSSGSDGTGRNGEPPFQVLRTDFIPENQEAGQDGESYIEVNYKAQNEPALILYTDLQSGMPAVPLNHSDGLLRIPVNTVESYSMPTIDVWLQYRLFYVIDFIVAGGPLQPNKNISDVVMTTEPDLDLFYSEGQHPMLTMTTEITGNRTTREGMFSYAVFTLNGTSGNVDGHFFLFNVEFNFGEGEVEENAHSPPNLDFADFRVLDLVSHKVEGRKSVTKFKLNTTKQDRGFILLRSRVEFTCSGCLLYETNVQKLIPFYKGEDENGNGVYVQEGDESWRGKDVHVFPFPGFFAFLNYPQYGDPSVVQCDLGETCKITCEVFGDQLENDFYLVIMRDGRNVETSSICYGFFATVTYSIQSVTTEDAGMYGCMASSLVTGRSEMMAITLQVE